LLRKGKVVEDIGAVPSEKLELARFVRARREEILQYWQRRVRALPGARALSQPALLDHIPEILEVIANGAAKDGVNIAQVIDIGGVRAHAFVRLDASYDVSEVIAELTLVRNVILELHAKETAWPLSQHELTVLNHVIDRVIELSVDTYLNVKTRTIEALDRVSSAALESDSVDTFLQGLLEAFVAMMDAMDTGAILLVEDGKLRLRATVGLEADLEAQLTLAIGDGFAGMIAQERSPRELRNAAVDPLVRSPRIRALGVRALYGVPLVHGREILGVAHVGSLTAFELSREDKRLISVMAHRAAAGVYQHKLREAQTRARQLADRALRARDQLLSVVSHDLKNPLGTVLMSAAMLVRKGEVDPDTRRHAERIMRSAERMHRLINDLVDWASVHEQRMKLERTEHDVGAILQEVVDDFGQTCTERAIELEQNIEPDIPEVLCDRNRILQVLANLISNAAHATPRGGKIVVSAKRLGAEALISVADSGRGLSAEDQQHVFERAWRGRSSTYEGTGLGLSIAHAIISAHGGRIWVESKEGAGATFSLTLPLAV
jgi:signal transduction histidine kinase